jgi:hypothetical protein
MAEPAIPEIVIAALAAVREGGKVNMLDRDGVAYLCERAGNFQQADWLLNASAAAYRAALVAMGCRRSQDQ